MKLTGIRPENPVAMMAAYGALRLLPGAMLRWNETHPELRWDGDIVIRLAERLPERQTAPELMALDDPRDKHIGGVEGFRALAKTIPHEWLSAYAAEAPEGLNKTDLLLLGGNHKFVDTARKTMGLLSRCDVAGKLAEALLGPWRYEDAVQAWGWDAAARLDAATLPMEVAAAHKPGVVGAYWLAWESLPLWQMVNGRTVGMVRNEDKGWQWQYPTCGEWLSWDGVKMLVLGLGQMVKREQRALGVKVWASPILSTSQYGKELGLARTLSNGRNLGGSRERQATEVLIV
jgi:hypothetical protein